MSEQTKSFLKAIGFIILGIMIGAIMEASSNPPKVTEAPAPQVITKETQVIVPPADYAKLQNNLPICQQELQLCGQGEIIAGDIFGNLSYYISNPSAIQEKTNEVNALTAQIKVLQSKIMQ